MQNNCPLCFGKSITSIYTVKDHFLSGDKFEIWRCSDCEFSFTHKAPSEKEISTYYKSEDYISHSDSKKGLVNSLYHIARKWMLKRKYRVVRKSSTINHGNCIDIGCGTGYFAGYMKSMGWKSEGIEADPEASKYAIEKFGIEVNRLDHLASLKSSSFDLVTMWHVLEHLYSPKEIMQEISRILKPNGICVIALPNTDAYDSGYYKELWAAWDVPRHLWHFNHSSFSTLIKDTGLQLRKIRKMPLDAFYISIISERYKGSGMGVLKGMIVGLFAWIVSLFKPTNSSSLIYIISPEN